MFLCLSDGQWPLPKKGIKKEVEVRNRRLEMLSRLYHGINQQKTMDDEDEGAVMPQCFNVLWHIFEQFVETYLEGNYIC